MEGRGGYVPVENIQKHTFQYIYTVDDRFDQVLYCSLNSVENMYLDQSRLTLQIDYNSYHITYIQCNSFANVIFYIKGQITLRSQDNKVLINRMVFNQGLYSSTPPLVI